jgi:cell wall-associated NlpC family hydrolase
MKEKLICIFLMITLSAMAFSQDFQVIFEDEEKQETPDKHALNTKEVKEQLAGLDSIILDTLRLHLIEKAKQYIGVNYKYGQANEDGFDCSGYVKYVYGQFGYALPHSSYEQYNLSKRLKQKNAKPGDLVFFITRGSHVSHVGIYMGDNTFIHSPSRGKQVRIDSLDSAYFKRHLVGFGTLIN